MFTVLLMGGLGNQLFQICAGLNYSITNGDILILPSTLHGKRTTTYWDSIFKNLYHTTLDREWNNGIIVQEHTFNYRPILRLAEKSKLFGYFQSYKYFEDNWDIIRKCLNIESYELKLAESPYVSDISIHFRMGDYLDLQHYHPVQKSSYYIRALSAVVKTGKESVSIFYEKEDHDRAVAILDSIKAEFPDLDYKLIDHTLSDVEQLIIMSLCTNNIISNSTFSWWAGYINKNWNKTVCYPKQWFGPAKNIDTSDLFPPYWKMY